MDHFIPYGHQSIDENDIQAIINILRGEWLTGGPAISTFESALCSYTGAKHAIAVANGTAALHVAMLAADINHSARVITSPNTFLASANCAEYVGAQVDFADIDPLTLNLSPLELANIWDKKVKAVVAVDFAGRACDMPKIAELARANNAIIIEDAAHALGSQFIHQEKYWSVGAHPWADMTTLSFHPVKTMTTGEGGAILTDNDELAARCRLYRNHGMSKSRPEEPWFYEMQYPGFNYRITDMQCALGLSQLKRIESFIQRRQEIVTTYNEALHGIDNLTLPTPDEDGLTAWHLYVVKIDFLKIGRSRTSVMQQLKERGIGTQVHYIPVHLQPYFRKKYTYAPGKCPNAEEYYEKALSLPLFPTMSTFEIERVIKGVLELFS